SRGVRDNSRWRRRGCRCCAAQRPLGVNLSHWSDVRCTTALPPKAEAHPRSCYLAQVPQHQNRIMSQLHDGRIVGLSALENPRITVTLGAASGCRLASTRCPIAELAVGRASSTSILLAAYPLCRATPVRGPQLQ